MITVVNKYRAHNYIYCGRGSALGNPFPIKPSQDRDKVCDMYEIWFDQQVNGEGSPEFFEQLENIIEQAKNPLNQVNLGCFCAPKRCHCETIKRYVDKIIRNYTDEI